LPLAGALKTTCEHCDGGRGQKHTGDQHRYPLDARVASRQTVG
jgi:hypothetical protein